MSQKDDNLNWPTALLIMFLMTLAVAVGIGEEFWLKVLG